MISTSKNLTQPKIRGRINSVISTTLEAFKLINGKAERVSPAAYVRTQPDRIVFSHPSVTALDWSAIATHERSSYCSIVGMGSHDGLSVHSYPIITTLLGYLLPRAIIVDEKNLTLTLSGTTPKQVADDIAELLLPHQNITVTAWSMVRLLSIFTRSWIDLDLGDRNPYIKIRAAKSGGNVTIHFKQVAG